MYEKKNVIFRHIKQNVTLYMFSFILFLTGIIFGALTVNNMSFIQKQDLYFYLEQFFDQLQKGSMISRKDILLQSTFYHAKYLTLFFILGLTIIGLPLIWLFLFIKGLLVGFSVGFLVNQLGTKGLLYATFAIAPQNMIIIPIYIIAATLAMLFSLSLLQKITGKTVRVSFKQQIVQYTMLFFVIFGLAFIGALIETYVANEIFKILLQ